KRGGLEVSLAFPRREFPWRFLFVRRLVRAAPCRHSSSTSGAPQLGKARAGMLGNRERRAGGRRMIRTGLAVAATTALLIASALAQQPQPAPAPAAPPDFSKVEIKTTDLGDGVYMLEGQGGNMTVATAKNGIIMVDGEYAPLHDKIKAAITVISNQAVRWLINTHFHG